jgi:hypothetical protein
MVLLAYSLEIKRRASLVRTVCGSQYLERR